MKLIIGLLLFGCAICLYLNTAGDDVEEEDYTGYGNITTKELQELSEKLNKEVNRQ